MALKEFKAEKMLYTMGEVTEMFDVKPSLIRFWEGRFGILNPRKNKKGNRLFTPEDVRNLEIIYHLTKERGMTLTGVDKCLKSNLEEVRREAEIVRRLQTVRSLLVEIREELKEEPEGEVRVFTSDGQEEERAGEESVKKSDIEKDTRGDALLAVEIPNPDEFVAEELPGEVSEEDSVADFWEDDIVDEPDFESETAASVADTQQSLF